MVCFYVCTNRVAKYWQNPGGTSSLQSEVISRLLLWIWLLLVRWTRIPLLLLLGQWVMPRGQFKEWFPPRRKHRLSKPPNKDPSTLPCNVSFYPRWKHFVQATSRVILMGSGRLLLVIRGRNRSSYRNEHDFENLDISTNNPLAPSDG